MFPVPVLDPLLLNMVQILDRNFDDFPSPKLLVPLEKKMLEIHRVLQFLGSQFLALISLLKKLHFIAILGLVRSMLPLLDKTLIIVVIFPQAFIVNFTVLLFKKTFTSDFVVSSCKVFC